MNTRAVFLTAIHTDPAPDLDPTFHRVREPLRYHSKVTGGVIEVPKGFPTDFASFRIGDLQLRGKTDRAAALHDFLYGAGDYRKWLADVIFYESCRSEGMGCFRAGLRCAAVLFAPAAHRAWRAHRRGTTHATKFLREYTFNDKLTKALNLP